MNSLTAAINIKSKYILKKIGYLFILFSSLQIAVAYAALPTDSSNTLVLPQTKRAYAIFVKESGYITNSSIFTGSSFTTTSACPTNFEPYVTISLGEVNDVASATIKDFSVCITSLTKNANNVTVNFIADANYRTFGTTNYGTNYISHAQRYDVGTSELLPYISWVSGNTNPDQTIMNKLSWVLYCYPTGLTVPNASCT
jgi:hypothetical protein